MTKEEKAAYDKAYNEKNKEARKAKRKIYKAKNKEMLKAYSKKYNQDKKEERNAYRRAWAKKNKDIIALRRRTYVAKKASATPELTQEDQGLILEYYTEAEHRTSATTINWEVDHVIPLSKGGLHEPGNLQVVPRAWNAAKSNNSSERWPYAY